MFEQLHSHFSLSQAPILAPCVQFLPALFSLLVNLGPLTSLLLCKILLILIAASFRLRNLWIGNAAAKAGYSIPEPGRVRPKGLQALGIALASTRVRGADLKVQHCIAKDLPTSRLLYFHTFPKPTSQQIILKLLNLWS